MSRVKYENPFAMGNLNDLMFARENDDIEYLKEWSKKAVTRYEATKTIQLKAFEKLGEIYDKSRESVNEIRHELIDLHSSCQKVIE